MIQSLETFGGEPLMHLGEVADAMSAGERAHRHGRTARHSPRRKMLAEYRLRPMALKSDPCVEAEADTRTQGTLAHAEGTGPRRADRGSAILSGPILATMLKLGLPTIVVLIVQTFVGIAERYFVSFLGTDALASVARWLVVAALGGGLGALFATVAIATSAFGGITAAALRFAGWKSAEARATGP